MIFYQVSYKGVPKMDFSTEKLAEKWIVVEVVNGADPTGFHIQRIES